MGRSSYECAGDGHPSPLLLIKLQLQVEHREDPREAEGLGWAMGQSWGLGWAMGQSWGLG